MAGGRFQGVANTFVEAMEANALAGTPATASARPRGGEMATVAADSLSSSSTPSSKKAKHDQQTPSPGKPGSDGGIRRIKMPPLDVFQRDYMETATPVILSGVSYLHTSR